MAEVLYTPDGKPIGKDNPLYVTGVGGGNGNSIEYDWKGTELGVRIEGEEEYEYKDLKGDTGSKGEAGTPGKEGTKGEAGAPGTNGADGKNGSNGIGVSDIQYDDVAKEIVFTMTEGVEKRIPFPGI